MTDYHCFHTLIQTLNEKVEC